MRSIARLGFDNMVCYQGYPLPPYPTLGLLESKTYKILFRHVFEEQGLRDKVLSEWGLAAKKLQNWADFLKDRAAK